MAKSRMSIVGELRVSEIVLMKTLSIKLSVM